MTPQVLDILWRNLGGLSDAPVGGPSVPAKAILNPADGSAIINPEDGSTIINPE